MLTHLAIRNIALIESLDLTFAQGFTALTGETGAGKSLLMDALGLALGERADLSLIRHGATTADVAATFTLPAATLSPCHRVTLLLEEQGIELEEGSLILRRQLKKEGQGAASKAWVNGTPVPAATLAQIGAYLVDIHAQHGTLSLLQPALQRDLLDTLANLNPLKAEVAQTHAAWQSAHQAYLAAAQQLEKATAEAELLTTWRQELEQLAYQPEEETHLLAQKTRLANFTQIAQHLAAADDALSAERGTLTSLRVAVRSIAAAARLDPSLNDLSARLTTTLTELEDSAHDLARAVALPEAEGNLEAIDDRLHALRAAARKHGVEIAALPQVLERLTAQTTGVENLRNEVEKRAKAGAAAQATFFGTARRLSAARQSAGAAFTPRIQQAIQKLQLSHAILHIAITQLPENQWNSQGAENVEILFSANPGTPPQPAAKVASGGELSRLMLALKSVLYQGLAPQTIIFDEIDTGLSGSTASAVGHAMASLANPHQIISITHHPQVAACAGAHARITKKVQDNQTSTQIQFLTGPARVEELARLLAGANITPQARAAAQSLLEESGTYAAEKKAA